MQIDQQISNGTNCMLLKEGTPIVAHILKLDLLSFHELFYSPVMAVIKRLMLNKLNCREAISICVHLYDPSDLK